MKYSPKPFVSFLPIIYILPHLLYHSFCLFLIFFWIIYKLRHCTPFIPKILNISGYVPQNKDIFLYNP